MNAIDYLKMFGEEVEYQAKPILEKELKEVKWISKENPFSPFDFTCKDNNVKLFIDVKSCIRRKIRISKNKFNDLKNGKYPNFYFFLYLGKYFHLISFEELLKDDRYKIIFDRYKYKYKYHKGHGGGTSFSVDKKLYPIFRVECEKRAISVSKWLRTIMKKQMDNWNVEAKINEENVYGCDVYELFQ